MSKLLINQYYNNLDRILQFGQSKNEQTIRISFFKLLNEYAHKQNYEVIAEITCMGTKGKFVRPDGIVKNLFGLNIGLWESKNEKTLGKRTGRHLSGSTVRKIVRKYDSAFQF